MTDRGTVDPARQGIATPDDPLAPRGADQVNVDDARAAVAGWRDSGMVLFGLHQIAVALADEVERLRESDYAAPDGPYSQQPFNEAGLVGPAKDATGAPLNAGNGVRR